MGRDWREVGDVEGQPTTEVGLDLGVIGRPHHERTRFGVVKTRPGRN